MPFTLIRGSFHVLGASPDGDSVRFAPTDPLAWSAAGLTPRVNAAGAAQLRLDAVDALETHYSPRSAGMMWRQPTALAEAAADRLLELLGFTAVTRTPTGTVTTATPEERPGAILTRFSDKYGRPVAIVYPDGDDPEPAAADGSSVFLTADGLASSANARLLDEGLVYPTFYSRLFVDLRTALVERTLAAREADLGVWEADVTTVGFEVTSRQQVMDELVMLPKLFRRFADYLTLQAPDDVDLGGFDAFLAARDDRLFTLPAGQATGFDTVVEVTGQRVRLTLPPEQLVFLEA